MPANRNILPSDPSHPEKLTIALLSPDTQDYSRLSEITGPLTWDIRPCTCIADVQDCLARYGNCIVVCEREYADGVWPDLLPVCDAQAPAVPLIVCSGHADERLWGEVLSRGGYDVLVKPFDADEVTRVFTSASRATPLVSV